MLPFLYAGNLSAQFYNQTQSFLRSNSVWVFGEKAGVDFNAGTPQPFLSGLANSIQFNDIGCHASVADKVTGALRFYTKKRLVWDRNGAIMPNGGNPLTESFDSFRGGSVIVPFINNPDRFYIFSLAYLGLWQNDHTSRLSYSVVDMTLNGGLGDIVPGQKNIALFTGLEGVNLSAGIIAVPGNNCDVWLIIYSITHAAFYVYHITAAGFNPIPVVSSTASEATLRPYYFAISPSRTILAMISGDCLNGCLNLYRFDSENGTLAQRIAIPNHGFSNFMPAFSPDNTKVYSYTQESATKHYFEQYSIRTYEQTAIQSSLVQLYTSPIMHAGNLRGYGNKLYSIIKFNETGIGEMGFDASGGQSVSYTPSGITLLAGSATGFVLPSEVIYPYKQDDTIPNVYKDTNVCFKTTPGGSMVLKAKPGFNSYVWDDGTAGTSRTVSDTGKYWVSYRGPCNYRVDTFIIRPPEHEYRRYLDTIGCFKKEPGTTIDLVASPGFTTYTWEDGTSGPVRTITQGGTYWVTYELPCNKRTDTFRITEPTPEYRLRLDTVVCEQSDGKIPAITLQAPGGFASYQWNDGVTGQARVVTEEGIYWVLFRDSCVESVDTFIIRSRGLFSVANNDTVVCEQRFPFDLVLAFDADRYSWPDGSNGRTFKVSTPGSYWVNLSKDGCSLTDSIHVASKYCPCFAQLLNAFSPNGDGLNDYFRIVIGQGCVPHGYTFRIFNRWGETVYESFSEYDTGWDGSYKGRPADAGVYGYDFSFKSAHLDKPYHAKGELTLIR